MGLFDAFKKKPEVKVEAPREPKVKKKSDKDIATEKGEAWVSVTNVELDPENIGNGAFELDWNDKFIANLVRSGYQLKPNEPEDAIVDRWFQDVCRNVVAENFEQWEAGQPQGRTTVKEDLGGGKTGIS